jgi:putative copper export protein
MMTLFIGLALLMGTAIYSMRHPRIAGAAATPGRRVAWTSLAIGCALVVFYIVPYVAGNPSH